MSTDDDHAPAAEPADAVPGETPVQRALRLKKAAIDARAEADATTTSEVIREALRRYLDVA